MRIIKDQVAPSADLPPTKIALDAFNNLSDRTAQFLDAGWSAQEVFWSRYFWIRTYGNLMSASSSDAGLEQFIFKVLEHPSPSCNPDWAQAERIDALAREQAALWRAL